MILPNPCLPPKLRAAVLLAVGLLLCAVPVAARVLVGVVPGEQSLLPDSVLSEDLGAYLSRQLETEVGVVVFASAADLEGWLQANPGLQLAILRIEFFGESGRRVFRVGATGASGRPGLEGADLAVLQERPAAGLLVRLQEALLGMDREPDGRRLMAELEIEAIEPLPARDGSRRMPAPEAPAPPDRPSDIAGTSGERGPVAARPPVAAVAPASPAAAGERGAPPPPVSDRGRLPAVPDAEPAPLPTRSETLPAGPGEAGPGAPGSRSGADRGPDLRSVLAESPPGRPVYVAPFLSVMVPPAVEEGVFDRFIDRLNAAGSDRDYGFFILKGGPASVDPRWLEQQTYVTGELFGYVEDSGCCATEIRSRGRIVLHRPGVEQDWEFEYPATLFFDHDRSDLAAEREQLAREMADTLAEELLKALAAAAAS